MKKERNPQRDSIDFGKEKISRLFRQLFFPTLIGMIFNALLMLVSMYSSPAGDTRFMVGCSGLRIANHDSHLY